MNIDEKLTINARWDNELVPAGKTTTRNLLIELTAPPSPVQEATRQPINLALVIDRSGSMNGAPIEAARRAATGIAECLDEHDRLSLVIFDDEVETLFSGLIMDQQGKRSAHERIGRIQCGATTNLAAGWLGGSRCVASEIEHGTFHGGHVLVLSDGMANQGICDPEVLQRHAQELAHRGIKSSAVGIGMSYSPLQLDALAEGGQGRLHDAESTTDIIDVVLGELGELQAITARDVLLTINYPSSAIMELLTRSSFDHTPCKYVLKPGDITANATRPIAVRVALSDLELGDHLRFDINVRWRGQKDEISYNTLDYQTKLQVVSPQEAEQNHSDLEVVQRIADLWEAALAYQAIRQNEQGDYLAASTIYEQQTTAFDDLVADLPDASVRMNRLSSTRSRVSRRWDGRSKRQAYTLSKKEMVAERDLRSVSSGSWHDYVEP